MTHIATSHVAQTGCTRQVLALMWLLALLVVGCGVDRALDGSQLEADIADQLLPEFPGAIRSVSCPDPVDPSPGQSLLCVATLGAQVLDVHVVIEGTEDELTTSASIDARFVAVNEIAALLAATFGDEIGIQTSVECGQPVMVLSADQPVVCTATDPTGASRSFDVLIADDGTLTLRLR